VRPVEEFLSTILRSSDDPEIAVRLRKVIDKLQGGADLETAARSAGLDLETAGRFLQSIKTYLTQRTPATTRSKAQKAPRATRSRAGKTLRLNAVTDGASRGNPGQAACAAIITDADGEELLRRARRLGIATNNVAEYHAVILALELAQTLGASELVLKLDSELVVKQLRGEYKIKHASLKPLAERARGLIQTFDRFDIMHVPREQTKAADELANAELDGKDAS
jgi:ribonuclease HI